MQAVLGFIVDNRMAAFHDLVGDLFVAMSRETVQDHALRIRQCNQIHVDLITGKSFFAFLLLLFLPHAGPDICVQDLSTTRGFARIVGIENPGSGICRTFTDCGVRFITYRCRHTELETENTGGVDPAVGHVITVADPAVGDFAIVFFMLADSKEIGHDLTRMITIGQTVDNRYRAVFSKVFDYLL